MSQRGISMSESSITKNQLKKLNSEKIQRGSDVGSETDGYFWREYESYWTKLDQKKLISIDYLNHRNMEFHNNHHTFRVTSTYDDNDMEISKDNNEDVLDIEIFDDSR
jgi:hypothetical protein